MPTHSVSTPRISASVQEEIDRLRQENETLKQERQNLLQNRPGAGSLTFSIAPKGGISVYGLQRMPVTLYLKAWERFLMALDEFKEFISDPQVQEIASTGAGDPRYQEAKANAAVLSAALARGEKIPTARDLMPDTPRRITRPVLVEPEEDGGDMRE